MKKVLDKTSWWFQMLGLMAMMAVVLAAFGGKDDPFLERMSLIALLSGAVLFVISCVLGAGMKGTGIFFLLIAALLAGVSIFVISKGYSAKTVSDCGVYDFRAEKYRQEQRTTRIRNRTTKTYTNYVRYEAALKNGDTASYERTTSKIGDAMDLVKRGDTKKRQVFFYNGNYYTDEPGVSEKEFLTRFLKWRMILFVSAGIYGALGAVFLFVGRCFSQEEDNPNEMSGRRIIR